MTSQYDMPSQVSVPYNACKEIESNYKQDFIHSLHSVCSLKSVRDGATTCCMHNSVCMNASGDRK